MTTNRRDFAKTAVWGAGAIAGAPLFAQAQTAPAAPGTRPAPATAASPLQPAPPRVPLAPPDRQPPDLTLPPLRRKAGWAIVGLGKLAVEEILPAFAEAEQSRPTALVSGHRDKADALAQAYGVGRDAILDYAGFGRLRDRSDVEIVYIVLPNSLHAEYTIKALEAGKHVLCEKPMAVSSAECRRMMDAARAANRRLMIAYRLHYEPFNRKVMALSRDPSLGRLRSIVSANNQTTLAPNIRLSHALGGGPVGDTGIYIINAGRYITGEEPEWISAVAQQPRDDPRFREVPEAVMFTLRYPSGVVAQCTSSFGTAESRPLRIHFSQGLVHLEPAYAYRGQQLRVQRGSAEGGDLREEQLKIQPVNHFAKEMDHFSQVVLHGGEIRTPGEMGLADMRIIEAINESVRSGAPVRL